MKKVYLFTFVAVLALGLIIASIMTFNPAVETWTSLFAGFAVGLVVVMMPSIIAYLKKAKLKSIK